MYFKLRFVIAVFTIGAELSAYAGALEEEASKQLIYAKLQSAILFYESLENQPWPEIRAKTPLSVGVTSPDVAALKRRLKITGELQLYEDQSPVFDEGLKNAIEKFQARNNLKTDGVVDAATRRALNVTPQQRAEQLRLNLKRWTDLLSQGDAQYVWINIPNFSLRLIDGERTVLQSKVIVGKPSTPTPELSAKISRVIINPSWTVPPNILRREVRPRISRDPSYLNKNHMHIRTDGTHYSVTEAPGPNNPLGQIKFDFENPFSVYLHDTNKKELFARPNRAFSHGCMRLENPLALLSALAGLDSQLTEQMPGIEKALEHVGTAAFDLGAPIPIHVTYITALIDDAGEIHFLDDIYHRDAPK